MNEDTAEKLVELAKRRGFFFQTASAYGGVSGFYTFGPQGAALKSNVEDAWRNRFTYQEGHQEIDAPTIMPEPVFEASGHLDGFNDMLIECGECGESHRADHVVEDATDHEEAESIPIPDIESIIADHDIRCPTCGASLAAQPVEEFNLMFETTIGPGSSTPGYLRPETAQGIFVEFPRLSEYARNQLPFGVTQIGRAYRNEISPRKSIIRVREFNQAELELFVDPSEHEPDLQSVSNRRVPLYSARDQGREDGQIVEVTVGEAVREGIVDNPWIAYYLGVSAEWYEKLGVDMGRFRFRQHLAGERAHYAVDCWDAEAKIDGVLEPVDTPDGPVAKPTGGDWVELAGIAYRGAYDLSKHDEHSDDRFTVFREYDDPKTVERATVDPDMSYLGPAYGEMARQIADALADLAERDRAAFTEATEDVTVSVDGETYDVPVERTGFAVETVTETGEHIVPHVVEPSFGVGRLVYTLLDHGYREDEVDGEPRTYLELDPIVASSVAGVFPLTGDEDLVDRAGSIAADLRGEGLSVTYDDSGNIGRRYRRQDEIGTPFCVTVDHRSLDDDTVTLRDRDTTDQVRIRMDSLADTLGALRTGSLTFAELASETSPVDAE